MLTRFPSLHIIVLLSSLFCVNWMSVSASAQDDPSESEASSTAEDEAQADEATEVALGSDAEPGTTANLVLEGLNNPCGIAIQPETGTVFIADSGNHQVVRMIEGKAEPVITDFPKDVYGKGPKVNIGPLGLLFLSRNRLVVGGGGLPDGEELLRVYDLPEDGKPIKAEAGMVSSFKLAASEEMPGEGNFYALAATPLSFYVTCNGDDKKGWVSQATLDGIDVTSFERHLATKEATQVNAPVGIAVSPEGYLVVGQMGAIDQAGDSLLTFYDILGEGEMLLNLETGLNDICSVAYSKRGQMYVLDYSWADPAEGGLFQIVADSESERGMKARRIMTLDKPTAMAFDADGSLYVTLIGKAENGESQGQLIQVTRETGL